MRRRSYVSSIRVTEEAQKAFIALKAIGKAKSYSLTLEISLLEGYVKEFPQGDKDIAERLERLKERYRLNLPVPSSTPEENDKTIKRYFGEPSKVVRNHLTKYLARMERFKDDLRYDEVQKAWLGNKVKDLTSFFGPSGIDALYEKIEEYLRSDDENVEKLRGTSKPTRKEGGI